MSCARRRRWSAAGAVAATTWRRPAAATPRSCPTRSRRPARWSSGRSRGESPAVSARGGGRVVALDYGSARCGVAVSDPTRTLPTPLDPVLRPATRRGFGRLVAMIGELEPAAVIVGLPLSLSGRDSDQTRETRAFVERLRDRLGVPIEVYDERFTTKLARRSGGAQAEDSRAAAVLLEEWLTRGASSEPRPGAPEDPAPGGGGA